MTVQSSDSVMAAMVDLDVAILVVVLVRLLLLQELVLLLMFLSL